MKEIDSLDGKINILYLEDSPKDFEIINEILQDAGFRLEMNRVDNESDFIGSLRERRCNIILADFKLPGYDAFSALKKSLEICPDVPFIVVSGSIGEETAIEFIKQGAVDYVLKKKPEKLPFAINRALRELNEKKVRKEAEDALHETLELYSLLFTSSIDAIMLVSPGGKIFSANPSACKIFGHTEKIICNLGCTGIMDVTDPKYLPAMEERARTGKFSGELTMIRSDGSKFPAEISSALFKDRVGNDRASLIIRDITERKSSERMLLEAKEKAEESDRLKTAFLHNISHEIRTPLNAIVGFSTLIADQTANSEKSGYFRNIIVESSDQLLSIITDIMNIATIETGQVKVNMDECNINTIIRSLHEQFSLKARELNISLNYKTGLEDIMADINTDKTKFIEILSNLIGNAFKFTLNGHINFGYNLRKDHLEFYVEDTGIGIAPEYHEVIFKRFRQVDVSPTRRFGGSGLGLSITKAYVELLGGTIWLTSKVGEGTAFYFTIPFKPSDQTVEKKLIVYSDKDIDFKNPIVVLIAEDDYNNYQLLEEILSGKNFRIIHAANGIKAVESCRQNADINLVLMDMKMPVMDGFEATRIIKELRPELFVIAQTAYSDNTDFDKMAISGCDDIISKPIDRQQLLMKIKKLVG